ncbi:MAG: alpha/beta hydrolase [Rhodocyclaceae bacterium]|nr:alpha/beta hydrolase [Pseudomonadota bacterium]MDQ7974532.1 alpha/beta hydrolase [Rhodocyclaceae bacterium]MDQ8001984.1 alpha/beta hydrolase [Pseudomonadota bacterium]MDQ8018834.1 alpha/beta hydrolase [Pseudomonadota bacterium]
MLHPQARALIDLIESRGLPPTHTLPPVEARAFYRERRGFTQPDAPEVAEVRELRAPGPLGDIPLRAYRPLGAASDAVLPVLVYYHGGGWVIGDLDTHDVLCRELCNASGCAVVAVDYRMGPEVRFPGAVNDVMAATRWVASQATQLRIDPARLAVGGDSAGGNLAAVVSIAARDDADGQGPLPIAFQLLIYPGTDMRRGHASHGTNGQGYVLTADTISYFHDHYIDDAKHDLDWRASPLLAASHAGLPPALVITAGYDPLRDEGLDYARALSAAGTRVSYVCFERQIHGFITMGRVLDEAHTAVALCAAELRRALAAPTRG